MSADNWIDIFEAATRNDHAGVRFFIQTKEIPANSTNELKQTAAHLAAKNGNLNIIQYLTERDSSVLAIKDIYGNSVLHVSAERGELPIIRYLLEDQKMDMYEPNELIFGNTIFHIAAEHGHQEVLDYLVKTAQGDVNVRNQLGEPPLFLTAEEQNVNLIYHLTENLGANLTITNSNDENVLFIFAKQGNQALPKYLLNTRRVSFDLNWRDIFGMTITLWATKYDHYDFVKYMVGRKLVDLNLPDNEGKTPLHEAAANGNYYMVRYLCRHGANIDALDKAGKKPLYYATSLAARIYLENVSKRLYRPQPRLPRSVSLEESLSFIPRPVFLNDAQLVSGANAVGSSWSSLNLRPSRFFSCVHGFLTLANLCFGHRQATYESSLSSVTAGRGVVERLAVDAVNHSPSFEN